MTELFETCREFNRFLAAGVFLWLTYRTSRAWPADWAKPDHVWHYRCLLLLGSGALLIVTWSAYWYIRVEAPATGLSLLSTVVCLFAGWICWRWPKPRAMRKEAS